MPPPAPTGRPALYCSLTCRPDNEYAVARRRWEERERRERPKREAEWRAQRKAQEAARLEAEETERQRNPRPAARWRSIRCRATPSTPIDAAG
jgi:hypothetical protein